MKLEERSVLSTMGQQPEKFAGGFFCFSNKLTSLAGCPSSVDSDFNCSTNRLTSLVGCPSSVVGYFDCNNNQLTALEGCPIKVGGYFNCSYNKLTSLEGCPTSVGDHFDCYDNKLTSLYDIHKQLKKVNGQFCCWSNPIKSSVLGLFLVDGINKVVCDNLWTAIVNKHLQQGRQGMLACQRELIDADLEEYARL